MDATPPPPPQRILVYDGDCSLCIAVSRRLQRWTRRGEETRRAAQAFEGEDAERIAASEAHNELAVIDPASKEIRNGVAGIVWWLEGSRLGWLARLLSWGPLRWAAGVVYPVIAYNRRILAPPKPRAIACACDPDPRPGATIALGAFALAVVGGAFWGAGAIRSGAGEPTERFPVVKPSVGVLDTLAAEGVTLAALFVLPTLFLVAAVRPAGARLLHAAAFSYSAALGAPLLVVGAYLQCILGSVSSSGATVLSTAGFAAVFYMAYGRRLAYMRASLWWWAALGLPLLLVGQISTLSRHVFAR